MFEWSCMHDIMSAARHLALARLCLSPTMSVGSWEGQKRNRGEN